MKTIFIILFICTLSSCQDSSSGKKLHGKENQTLQVEVDGTYRAILRPLNEQNALMNGSATIVRKGDDFIVDVRLSHGPVKTLVRQSLHQGHRCPTEEDDTNADGIIDAAEGAAVYQGILIPLDDDISSLRMGLGTFPLADDFGSYFYSRVTSYETVLSDLREEDLNPDDEYVKLGSRKNFNTLGRVVVLSGVPVETVLPETVTGIGRLTPHQSLPIACGILKRVEGSPGTIDQDVSEAELSDEPREDDGAIFTKLEDVEDSGNYGEEDELVSL
jgi:hypothetical protein